MIVKNLNYSNAGQYTCAARNILGSFEATGNLTVRGKRKIETSKGLKPCCLMMIIACVQTPPPPPSPSLRENERRGVCDSPSLIVYGNTRLCVDLKNSFRRPKFQWPECFMSLQFSKCRCMRLISIEQLRE